MKRILTWHFPQGVQEAPAYYVEDDYEYSAVRIHADTAPMVSDAEFEILKDGASIMSNRSSIQRDVYGRITSNLTTTTVALSKGETSEELADDFAENTIYSGSWLTCTITKDGGGKNFTVQLELTEISDEGSEE